MIADQIYNQCYELETDLNDTINQMESQITEQIENVSNEINQNHEEEINYIHDDLAAQIINNKEEIIPILQDIQIKQEELDSLEEKMDRLVQRVDQIYDYISGKNSTGIRGVNRYESR